MMHYITFALTLLSLLLVSLLIFGVIPVKAHTLTEQLTIEKNALRTIQTNTVNTGNKTFTVNTNTNNNNKALEVNTDGSVVFALKHIEVKSDETTFPTCAVANQLAIFNHYYLGVCMTNSDGELYWGNVSGEALEVANVVPQNSSS